MDLKKKLEDAEYFDTMSELQELAEEMFIKYSDARTKLAGEKAKSLVLMQEIQRLEEENGNLKTELDNTQRALQWARKEVEGCDETLKAIMETIRENKDENDRLQKEIYGLQMKLREKEQRLATDTAPAAGAVTCPKCGSMEVETCERSDLCRCRVCGKSFEVSDGG